MSSAFDRLEEEGRKKRKQSSSGPSAKPKLSYGSKARLPSSPTRKGGTPKRQFGFTPREKAVAKSRFVRRGSDSQRHIIHHIDYIADKNKKPWEERVFFDRENSGLTRDQVIERISLNQGKDIAMHKVILSPGDNAVNLREYSRESIERLEESLGYRIDWFAVEHYNTDHYHAHVVIAGRIPDQVPRERGKGPEIDRYLDTWAKEMEGKDLKIWRYNLENLREAGNDYLRRDRSIDRDLELAIEREFGLNDWTHDKEVKDRLGIDVWYRDKDFMERELGLTGYKKDYAMLEELGLDNYDYDRQIGKELGLTREYQLGRPFVDALDNDNTASVLYGLNQDKDKERELDEHSEHLGKELYKLPSYDRESKDNHMNDRELLDKDLMAEQLYQLPEMDDLNARDSDQFASGLYNFQSERAPDDKERLPDEPTGREHRRDDDLDRGADRGGR